MAGIVGICLKKYEMVPYQMSVLFIIINEFFNCPLLITFSIYFLSSCNVLFYAHDPGGIDNTLHDFLLFGGDNILMGGRKIPRD